MGRRTTIGERKPCRGVKAESHADNNIVLLHTYIKSKGRHEGGEVCNTLLEEGDLPTSGSHYWSEERRLGPAPACSD